MVLQELNVNYTNRWWRPLPYEALINDNRQVDQSAYFSSETHIRHKVKKTTKSVQFPYRL